jgi:hypothetical protein
MCGNNKNCKCHKTHECHSYDHSHSHSHSDCHDHSHDHSHDHDHKYSHCHSHSHEHHCHNVYFDARSGCMSNISCILSSDKYDTSKVKYIVKYDLDKKRCHYHKHGHKHNHKCNCGCH